MKLADVDFFFAAWLLFVFIAGAGLLSEDQQAAAYRSGEVLTHLDANESVAVWRSLLRAHRRSAKQKRRKDRQRHCQVGATDA